MLLIPAIDLKDGRCVRLRQGRMDDETIFSDDPVQVAGRWVESGARRLHLVDLNGAFAGEPVNGEAIRAIAKAYPDLPIQVGGGIRDESTIEAYLDVLRERELVELAEELERRGMPYEFYGYDGLSHYFAQTADDAITPAARQRLLGCSRIRWIACVDG